MIQLPKPFFFEGGSQAVILLHAYASNSNDVRMLGRYLQRQGYTVLGPMFTGHGTGEPADILTKGSPDTWWQDTQQAVQSLRDKHYERICIFGLSLGGIFAMRALEQDSGLLGGGAFSSPIITSQKNNLIPEFVQLAKATYKYQQLDGDAEQQRLNWLTAHLPAQLTQINQFAGTVANGLSQVQQPTFIAQGGQDGLIDAQKAYALRDALTSSQVSFHYYEDAGHVLTVNSAHHQLERDLTAYLKRIFN
ncbi:carboxylesterase [Secundilactobacillus pentosiphilus]|uniref:Carboxylesterase n=1 Tax=Secundilactobacillus pentosiphilus TaxID=1714682 RepID=A0A1Z5IZ62_9LACO|nr:alpha/beta fold hydrolase [Secundilactobacillus pentosiphilus]GAX07130.1 carboxylesterase [Secundilactobacillus pentosiphilus]